MPRHDYNFPPDWSGRTDEEKHKWYLAERCRRQAERQRRAGAMPFLDFLMERSNARVERRLEARNETVSLEERR
jgi:hypothetical protein